MCEQDETPIRGVKRRQPGAVDPVAYAKWSGRWPEPEKPKWGKGAKAGMVLLVCVAAAAGNVAPRWNGDFLHEGTVAEAVSLARDQNTEESRREMALELLTRESEKALDALVGLARSDPGPTGDKAGIRARKVIASSVDKLQALAAEEGRGAQRAAEALEKLRERYRARSTNR